MSGKAALFMKAATKGLIDEKQNEEKTETIISKIDKQVAEENIRDLARDSEKTTVGIAVSEKPAEKEEAAPAPEPKEPEQETIPEDTALEKESAAVHENIPTRVEDDISSEIAKVKPGKRRPQSMRRNEVGIRSMDKTDVPDKEKNLTTARTFSMDMETSARLDAAVKVLQDSGAIVDKRPISPSAFVRIAVKKELQRLSEENGKAFDKAIEDEISRTENAPVFKL